MPDVVTNSLIVMFADDAKFFKVIDSLIDCIVFQNDLDSLYVWSIRNELLFQPPKCDNLRISHKRNSFQRTVGLRIICTFARNQIAIVSTHVLAICSRNDRILLATCSNFARDLIASITCSRANLH